MVFSRLKNIVRQVAPEFSNKNVPFMAAGIAYNAFVSLVPLLLVLLLAISVVGGEIQDQLVVLARESLSEPIAEVVVEVFRDDAVAPSASVVGFVVLIWGSLKIFRGLDTAFSEIYETTGENSFVNKLIDGAVVLVAVVVAILATVAVTAAFATLAGVIPFVGLLTPVVLVFGLIVAFFPMYYRFPDTDVQWKHVLPGVAFAAVGWAVFQSLFQAYVAVTGGGTGSVFGGVVVVVTWLYFSGLVLLLGAVLNAVLGGHTSGKSGGVGRGASDYETSREETFRRDEFSKYLYELRAELTGRHGNRLPAADGETSDRSPPLEGTFEVIEQSKPDDDERQWELAIRWRAIDPGRSDPDWSAEE